ncbi:B-cell receptor CD22-like isoform X2 [Pimephales promelas]|uniref:B-cell receptor CD22-like isoform X2 n=1 Tax=Pimephales promelas TaxID=90988 RepID=UPI001955E553|nr:B-cell receptor CD22-like isoform X2 [Pimephales promelas]
MVMSDRMTTLLIFLLMIHGVSSEDRSVSYSPPHICALKDSTVIMRCTYKYPISYQIKKVFWTKGPLIMSVEAPDLSNDPEYRQRLQYLGDEQQNCTVRLSHVTLKDSQIYYCRFITDRYKWTGKPGVTLTVTDLQVESPERVTEGDSVSLTCKSSCALTDRATFIWYRNSLKILTESKFRNTLILNPVRREDSGRYSCAVDGHTHVSPDVHLNVMYPPRSVSVSIISPSGVIFEGDSVTLNCISDSNPPAGIHWFKGGTFVGSGRIFSISKIRSDDSGEYKCRSFNEYGEKYSDTVTLNVMYPPRNVSVSIISPSGVIVEGDSVTLKCISDSNPPAGIRWFKGGTIVGSGRIFSISKIRSDDSGEYKCRSFNKPGEKYSDPVNLNVMYPPRNVSVSIIQSGQIWAGDSVTLKCISDSNPPAVNFSWFKENESSAVGSGQSFSALQSGRFYCQAHNQHGSQRSDAVTVTVKYWRIYHIAIVASVCGVVATVIIVLLTCWKKLHSKSTTNNSDGISMKSENKEISYVYENVGAVHPCTNAPKMTFPLYENVTIYENCTAHRNMP